MTRVMNFNPGPAALPTQALERAQRELLDLEGTGMSVIEHSHRGKAFSAIHDQTLALCRKLLGVPEDYDVLLLQGGASHQFAMVPMNLLPEGKSADYIITGSWAKKALSEAKTIGQVRVAASTEVDGKFPRVPKQSELDLSGDAAYVHMTSNNTIAGTQWHEFPDTGDVPLVADMSSDIMWRPIDVSRFGVIYAGAQKNIGPSGLAVVIIRKALVEGARTDIPKILRYSTHADANSLYNTPPTFSIYLMRNVFELVEAAGGVAAVEKRNREKGRLLYEAIDGRPDFYRSPVEVDSRSFMNVVFNLPTKELEAEFIESAQSEGLVGLKGHRSVGGVRVSMYNAAPVEWVGALVDFMSDFHRGS